MRLRQRQTSRSQYVISFFTIICVALLGFAVQDFITYKAVALLLLMAVSLLAMRFDIWPVLMAACLSAIIWNFFFIPPRFTFHIRETDDILLFLMYFIIALVNAVLTHKIKMNERKARDREEKVKVIKLYNTLFNSLSHELRTPITTILSATDTLQDQHVPLSADTKAILINEIGIAGTRLNQQVDDLLNMSRLESGMLQPNLDWCDLNDLMAGVIRKVDPPQRARILFQPQPNLPLFKLDTGLIEQAIFNILHNALQYTPPETPITITTQYHQETCQITIADQGPGITEEEKLHIFDAFYRAPANKTGGTGLGLSIAKGFIEAHEGHITLSDDHPSGSRFTITIPAVVSFINQIKHE